MCPHLPEAEVAVRVGVGGEVPAVGGKGHGSDGSFVPVDGLGTGERTPMWEIWDLAAQKTAAPHRNISPGSSSPAAGTTKEDQNAQVCIKSKLPQDFLLEKQH